MLVIAPPTIGTFSVSAEADSGAIDENATENASIPTTAFLASLFNFITSSSLFS